jgi:betaine-aldehyde dehydrogenase
MNAWPRIVDLIGVTWRPADVDLGDWLDDPNSGDPLQRQGASSPAAIDEALQTAADAHERGEWGRTSPCDRSRVLRAVADGIDSRVEEIAQSDAINSGVPIMMARLMAQDLGQRFRGAAEALLGANSQVSLGTSERPVLLMRLPLGPVLIMTAWNASTFIAAGRVASALAAGCPVILKPSEWAPWGCQLMAEEISRAGLPPGVFQLVHGGPEQGEQLVADSRISFVSFTGGQTAGRQIAMSAAAGFKPVQLELGGSNPVIVCRDADPLLTASSLADGMTRLNGQWCEGPGRVYVSHDMHDELVSNLLARLATLKVGHSLDPETRFGPIAYRRHRDHLTSQLASLRRRGGVIHEPLEVPSAGFYMSPAVITGLEPASATDELFGPVVTVHRTDSDDESLWLANHPASGLDAYVFGANIYTCMAIGAGVIAGEVRINGTRLEDLGPNSAQTFWGSAGIGAHLPAVDMIELFRGYRVVGVDAPWSSP